MNDPTPSLDDIFKLIRYDETSRYHNFDSLPESVHIRQSRFISKLPLIIILVALIMAIGTLIVDIGIPTTTVLIVSTVIIILSLISYMGQNKEQEEYLIDKKCVKFQGQTYPWSTINRPKMFNRTIKPPFPTNERGIILQIENARSIYITTSDLFLVSSPISKLDLPQIVYMYWKHNNMTTANSH